MLGDNKFMPRPRGDKPTDPSRCFRCPDGLWVYLQRAAVIREKPVSWSVLVREILEDYAKKNPLPKGLRHK